MKKVNSVIAKALAQKIIIELRPFVEEENKRLKSEILAAIDNDPLSQTFNKLIKEASNTLKQLHKVYPAVQNGINDNYCEKEKTKTIRNYISIPYNIVSPPNVDNIKNDIILEQASLEDFDADEMLKKLTERYKKQLTKK